MSTHNGISKKMLCIIPQKNSDPGQNPGGQITAANGLVRYLELAGFTVHIINTVENSFPIPPNKTKLYKALLRVVTVLQSLLNQRYFGTVLFSGGGLSFLDRIFLCTLFRLFGVNSLLFFRNSDILNIKKGTIKALFLRMALIVPNHVAVQGMLWEKHLSSIGVDKNKISVIRNWTPPSVRLNRVPKVVNTRGVVRFVFVGWIVEAKGVREIAQAINLLKQNGYLFKFTFVGAGTLELWLRSEHAKQGWGDDVLIAGWKSQEDVISVLSNSHVFVLPSYREGFPNALLEALAIGVPAISTSVGAIPETLIDGKNGFIVPSKNGLALCEAMKKYILNPEIITEHSYQALEASSHNHDWGRNCGQLMNIF